MGPGGSVGHAHARFAEAVFGLAGRLAVRVPGREFVLEDGGLAALPPGVPHTPANPGPVAARALSLTAPAGIEDFCRAAGRPSPDPGAAVARPGDADRVSRLGPLFAAADIVAG